MADLLIRHSDDTVMISGSRGLIVQRLGHQVFILGNPFDSPVSHHVTDKRPHWSFLFVFNLARNLCSL